MILIGENLNVMSQTLGPALMARDAGPIEEMAREAVANGAKILVTPEGAVEGYVVNVVNKEENKDLNLEKISRAYPAGKVPHKSGSPLEADGEESKP